MIRPKCARNFHSNLYFRIFIAAQKCWFEREIAPSSAMWSLTRNRTLALETQEKFVKDKMVGFFKLFFKHVKVYAIKTSFFEFELIRSSFSSHEFSGKFRNKPCLVTLFVPTKIFFIWLFMIIIILLGKGKKAVLIEIGTYRVDGQWCWFRCILPWNHALFSHFSTLN